MRNLALDFETSGLDYYTPTFQVLSCAISWRDDEGAMCNKYVEGEMEVQELLETLMTKDLRIIVHNLPFEQGVLTCRFPSIKFKEMWCTQRLLQVGDSGRYLKRYEKRYTKQKGVPKDGLSLEAGCSRWLDKKYHNHKKEAHDWIHEKFGLKAKVGEHLKDLPYDIMVRYNTADTDNTLRLYEELVNQFESEKYIGYRMDHQLYRGRCAGLVEGYRYGVKVDPERNQKCIDDATNSLQEIYSKFLDAHPDEIRQVIAQKVNAFINDPTLKKDKGRYDRLIKIALGLPFGDRDKVCGFNINSSKDLFHLYNGILGISPPFITRPDKDGKGGGSPSFKKSHLKAWHESGRILENRGTLKIIKKQAESLQVLASRDGRWHLDQVATGARTGRLTGSKNDGG